MFRKCSGSNRRAASKASNNEEEEAFNMKDFSDANKV